MPGKEILHGQESNGTSESFLFTSESVGEGHPGNLENIGNELTYSLKLCLDPKLSCLILSEPKLEKIVKSQSPSSFFFFYLC